MYNNLFKRSRSSHALVTWRSALERTRVMVSLCNKMILSLTNGLTKEWCIAVYLFWVACRRLGRKSGWLHLALYLKQCRVCLQRFVAQDGKPSLTVYVSLTNAGIPRIIPSFHRQKIRERNYDVVRLYLSLFSLSKLIALAAKVSKDTFSSIVTPYDPTVVLPVCEKIRPQIKTLLDRYIPGISSIPLNQGVEFVPTWKSVPSSALTRNKIREAFKDRQKSLIDSLTKPSVFTAIVFEFSAFRWLLQLVDSYDVLLSPACLWYPMVRFCYDPRNDEFCQMGDKLFRRTTIDQSRLRYSVKEARLLTGVPAVGNLGNVLSGDGKRRVFAIGNYFYQRILSPVHDWLAACLKSLPMDGTFDQLAPLDRLRGSTGWVHSIDLKSATDRWPIFLLMTLFDVLFGKCMTKAVVETALGINLFDVPFIKRKDVKVGFAAGQPLGFKSSWPLFALSHHVILWWAAEQVYPGKRFKRYAILGDDVVIADTLVKDSYIKTINDLGVKISEGKSISSPIGCCEFAKKFRVEGLTRDISPLSFKSILQTLTPVGWLAFVTSQGSHLSYHNKMRLSGLGFRARVKCPPKGRRAFRYWVMLIQSCKYIPLEVRLSVVVGSWLHPSLVGRLWWRLAEKFSPSDLQLVPQEFYSEFPDAQDLSEITVLKGWMKQYLNYLRWYVGLFQSSECSLGDFESVPLCTTRYYRESQDVNLKNLGFIYKVYDLAYSMRKTTFYELPEPVFRDPFFEPYHHVILLPE